MRIPPFWECNTVRCNELKAILNNKLFILKFLGGSV